MGSSLKTRMIMILLPEWEKGSQGSAWGMLQRERELQGVRRPAGPVQHTPYHTGGGQMKILPGYQAGCVVIIK